VFRRGVYNRRLWDEDGTWDARTDRQSSKCAQREKTKIA